jgi:carbamoyl-phosphate synthase large subunit
MDLMNDGKIDLVINVSREFDESGRPDGFFIRRRAAESGISLITDLQLARAFVEALIHYKPETLAPKEWSHFVHWHG